MLKLAGEVLFKLHADDLKTELENLLYDLVRENLPQWKQMRGLEVTAAIVAETLIEMGVLIFNEPPEIHWPNGLVTKMPAGTRSKKKGKSAQKHKHGIYGELVASLAPSIPAQNKAAISVAKKGPKSAKFKMPVKGKAATIVNENSDNTNENPSEIGASGDAAAESLHQGLPAQGRRGQLHK